MSRERYGEEQFYTWFNRCYDAHGSKEYLKQGWNACWKMRQSEIDALKAEIDVLNKNAGKLAKQQYEIVSLKIEVERLKAGCGTVCQASQFDGIICPHDSCDIEDGIREMPRAAMKNREVSMIKIEGE